jgi:hypothetical protein
LRGIKSFLEENIMSLTNIIIGVVILAVSLAFSFFIEWLQNREIKDNKNSKQDGKININHVIKK